MVIRVSDKKQNYNNVTKLLVKPSFIVAILVPITGIQIHKLASTLLGWF